MGIIRNRNKMKRKWGLIGRLHEDVFFLAFRFNNALIFMNTLLSIGKVCHGLACQLVDGVARKFTTHPNNICMYGTT